MTKLVMASFADINNFNGQGVFSRSIALAIGRNCKNNEPINFTLICPKSQEYYSDIFTEFLGFGNTLKFIPKKVERSPLWQLIANIYLFSYLIRSKDYILIHSVKPYSFFLIPLLILRSKKTKIILLVEGLATKTLKKLPFRYLHFLSNIVYFIAFNYANIVISAYPEAEEWTKSLVLSKSKNRFKTIPCGVHTEFAESLPPHCTYGNDNELIVGYVGSMRRVHALDELIQLARYNPTIKLKLIGSGREKQRIEYLVQRHNMSSRVEFFGTLPPDHSIKILQTCHCTWGVLAKSSYGYPIKVNESLCIGIPAVVHSRVSKKYFLDNHSHILFQHGVDQSINYHNIRNSLDAYWSQSDLQIKAIMDTARKLYSWNNYYNEIVQQALV